MTIHPEGESDEYPYYEPTVTESSWHYKAIQHVHAALEERYALREDVFVGANNFVYWQKDKKSRKQAPDVYVCFGARNVDRRSYKTWEEGGIAPQVVFEVTSESSQFTDVGTKKAVYEAWGVEEYYLFDPLHEYIPKGLLTFVNKQGILQPRTGKRIFSPRLELDLRAERRLLRFFLPGSSQRLLTYQEVIAARQVDVAARREAEAAQREAEGAQREAEAARREAEGAQREAGAARREAEAARREAEAASAVDRAARQEAEARATHLQAELANLRRKLKSD